VYFEFAIGAIAPERRYLFVIDDAKALRAAIERVFGERAEVQRCQLHKRRNVAEYLPQGAQSDYDRGIRNAYAMTGCAEAKAELQKIFRQLERVNPSAAWRKVWKKPLRCTASVWASCCDAAWPTPIRSNPAFLP
jgi:transposase-like protein